MIKLNNLAKYNRSQIEGELKQEKRLIAKYWLYVVIFVTFASVLTAIAIVSTCLYVFHYHNEATEYLAVAAGAAAVVFWVLFFIYFALNMKANKITRILDAYLKNNAKKKK